MNTHSNRKPRDMRNTPFARSTIGKRPFHQHVRTTVHFVGGNVDRRKYADGFSPISCIYEKARVNLLFRGLVQVGSCLVFSQCFRRFIATSKKQSN